MKDPLDADFAGQIGHTAGVKNAGVFLSFFLTCCAVAAQALPSPHPLRRASKCELEPLPLPPPAPGDKPAAQPEPAPDENAEPSDDKADLDVEGTLAQIAPKEKMRVTVLAKNLGKSAWTPKDVRVIVRWVDFDSGTRRRWSYNWIREVVQPDGELRQPFDVVVPPKAGRYKVIFGLVRRPAGGKDGDPPAYDAPQDKWPGEFAAIAFAVNVGDAAPPTP